VADIVIADSTGRYDGRFLETRPLGATETSVIYLARALARRGHRVTAFTDCDAVIRHEGVAWRPLTSDAPTRCDLYVAVQHAELLGFVKSARQQVIWVLWEPKHLEHHSRI